MKVNDLVTNNSFKLLNSIDTQLDIETVYICDLLSWVMAHAGSKCAWITIQSHVNIVAVAVLLEMSCIIVPENVKVEEATLQKAAEENIPILSTELSSYQVACILSKVL